ncbi:MAG: beta-lactamase family protein [Ectothiorhodospiraceae bacterium]|nr:beta-lactamase family protein [Ectothiorhodospiraceae bacterium]MCH8505528.1 beta-lactamase family protein [Ectothiorhodospiraceae bacterium]
MIERVEPESVGLCSRRLERVSNWAREQVERQRLPGLSVLIHRRGAVAHLECAGLRDVEQGRPVEADTVFRIYSMTKPVTSVALMMLYEEGHFQLDDPLAKFIPAFRDMQVMEAMGTSGQRLVPASQLITIRHLLTHTSGLTYGFMQSNPVDALYREHKLDFSRRHEELAEMVDRLAALPLICHPGSAWNYSVSTDVAGRLVEVLSGLPLERFFRERIFQPLGMTDTGFTVSPSSRARFAALYGPEGGGGMGDVNANRDPTELRPELPGGLRLIDPADESSFHQPARLCSGGGGLVGTIEDYLRFSRMLLNGGALEAERLLSPKTVAFMTANHLGGDLASMGQPRFSETSYEGIGFGLGFSVMLDPARAQVVGTAGEYAWGGAASTAFWVDPAEQMIVILMTQLMPSSSYPLRRELRTLTYQALID